MVIRRAAAVRGGIGDSSTCMKKLTFSCVKSVSRHIESYSKIKNTPKKFQKKLTVRGGGLNAYGQPDPKISAFFGDFPERSNKKLKSPKLVILY